MQLKKRFFAAAAVLIMAASVVYGSTLEIKPLTEEPVQTSWIDREDTIYFYYSDESMTNFINRAAVAFGDRENVHVIPIIVNANEYLEEVNRASIEGEHVPDVLMLNHDNLEKAYLVGLADEIKDYDYICNRTYFSQTALDAVTYNGKMVAYPLYFETSVLVYNKDYMEEWAAQRARKQILGIDDDSEDGDEETADTPAESTTDTAEGSEEAEETEEIDEELLRQVSEEILASATPATLADILDIADTFDAPEGMEIFFNWDVSDVQYNYWIVGNYLEAGGRYGDNEKEFNIVNDSTIQCLEQYQALNQFFSIEASNANYEDVVQGFIRGESVFIIATSDVLNTLETAKANGEFTAEYGITTMPDVTEELKSRSMSITGSITVNGYSTNKEIANKFASYLVNDCASYLYDSTGKISANMMTDAGREDLQTFKREYSKSISSPKLMTTGNFWLLIERTFAEVWSGGDATAFLQELQLLIDMQIGNN